MKKLVLVLLLVAFIAVGAFANDPRPDGFGIGIVGGGARGWTGGGGFGFSYGLSLHAANTYWGIFASIASNWFSVGVTGDFVTLMGGTFGDGPLGFYIDGGLYGTVFVYDTADGSDFAFGVGARLPIGLSLNFDIIDIWLAAVPQIGVRVGGGSLSLGGGWGPEIGLRVWF